MYWTLTWGVCAWPAASSCSRAPKRPATASEQPAEEALVRVGEELAVHERELRQRGGGGGVARVHARAPAGRAAARARRARRCSRRPPRRRRALGDERAGSARACGGQRASSRASARRLRRRRQLERVRAGVEAEAEAEDREGRSRTAGRIHLAAPVVGDERRSATSAPPSTPIEGGRRPRRRRRRRTATAAQTLASSSAGASVEAPRSITRSRWMGPVGPSSCSHITVPGPSDDHWSEGEARLKASTCWRARSSSSSMVAGAEYTVQRARRRRGRWFG